MSSFNDKIDQVYAVLSSVNARHHSSTRAIGQLNTEITTINEKINQLTGQINQLVSENQREQEDLREMARQYAEWREQVQAMQADIHLILQHLGKEMGDAAGGGEDG